MTAGAVSRCGTARNSPESIRTIHIVRDNIPTHHGKKVRKWLKSHPRSVFQFTAVHCS